MLGGGAGADPQCTVEHMPRSTWPSRVLKTRLGVSLTILELSPVLWHGKCCEMCK